MDKKEILANKKAVVLGELRKHGRVGKAASKVGVSRRTIWNWQQNDAVFSAGYDAAIKEGR